MRTRLDRPDRERQSLRLSRWDHLCQDARWRLRRALCIAIVAGVVVNAAAVRSVAVEPTFSDANWVSIGTVPGADSAILTMTSSARDLCVAGDFTTAGGKPSAYIARATLLAAGEAPVISEQPVSQTILTSANASLTVTATGTPPLAYQWLKDGVPLVDGTRVSGALAAQLEIESVALGDRGAYSVTVTNGFGVAAGEVAYLKVLPSASGAIRRVLFESVADTRPSNPNRYSAEEITPLPFVGNKSIGNGSVINSGIAYQSPNFYPYVLFDFGRNLTLLHPGHVRKGASMGFEVGNSGWFEAGAVFARANDGRDAGDGVSVVIMKNSDSTNLLVSAEISTDHQVNADSPLAGSSATSLSTAVALEAGDVVRFVVFGHAASDDIDFDVTALDAFLEPLVPPFVTVQPQSQSVSAGTNATLSVTALGTPPLFYQWYQGTRGDTGTPVVGATNNVFASPILTTNATFWVRVSEISNSTDSATATVTVLFPPQITSQPRSRGVVVGTNAFLGVTVTGTMPMSYQWYRGGIPLTGATNALLGLVGVGFSDEGTYTVTVTNVAGSVTSSGAVLAVREPVTLELVRQWPGLARGNALSVAAQGDRAHVAAGEGGLIVVDISNPANPVRLGGYYTGGYSYGVAVVGRYAYMADGSAGLRVIDIADPANPVQVGVYDTAGEARGVAVNGNYAYVADYSAGLQLIDVSNPSAPIRVGGWTRGYTDSYDGVYGVAVSGNFVYLADWGAGLQVIDVSNPSIPVRVGGFDTQGAAFGVAVSGNYAYVADGATGLHVIDVSNPADPVRSGVFGGTWNALGVAVQGNYAYVADNRAGLQVVDVSNPSGPALAAVFDTLGEAEGVAVFGTVVCVADGGSGLQVIDVSNPTKPMRLGGYHTEGDARDATVSGTSLYLADGESGLQIMDVAELANPVWRGGYDTSGAAYGVTVVGERAYVADYGTSLQVIDVMNSTSPIRTGGYDTNGLGMDVAVSGSYAFVANQGAGLEVLDVSNPVKPVWVSRWKPATVSVVSCVVVRGNYAYAGTGHDLRVIDIADPATPVQVGVYESAGVYGVALSGHYAYLATGGSTNLWIIDVSNPVSPLGVGGLYVSGLSMGVAVSGNYAYTADYGGGMHVVDVSNPSFPVRVGSYRTPGLARNVAVVGDYVYVACGAWGLTVLRTGIPAALGFTEQPQAQTIFAGSGATFSIAVSGKTPFAYQWYRNGLALNGATNATLHIDPVKPEDAGSYYVVVGNILGTLKSQPAYLTLAEPARIDLAPEGLQLLAGENGHLRSVGGGTLPLSYYWRKDGQVVTGATEAVLALTSITALQAGSYTLQVSNRFGSTLSAPVTVMVVEAPGVISSPQNATVSLGGRLTLSVNATGTGPVTYQWRHNGMPIPNGTNAVMEISPVTLADGGTYTAVASNPWGLIETAPALVTVTGVAPLYLSDTYELRPVHTSVQQMGWTNSLNATAQTDEPLHAGKAGGKSLWMGWVAPTHGLVTFRTTGGSFDTLLAVYAAGPWAGIGSRVVASDEDRGGYLTSELTFTAEAGQEYAIAVDGFAGASGIVVLGWTFEPVAQSLPVILAQSRSQVVLEGTTSTLEVQVTGNALTYQWQRNGQNLAGANSPQLNLGRMDASLAGTYTVSVVNGAGLGVLSADIVVEAALNAAAVGPVSQDKWQDLFASQGVGLHSSGGSGYIGLALGEAGARDQSAESFHGQGNEATECEKQGGGARWLWLRPQADGGLVINTQGSTVVDDDGDALSVLLGVYQFRLGQGLTVLGCDSQGGELSAVTVPVTQGQDLVIQLNVPTGAKGTVRVNWNLAAAAQELRVQGVRNGWFELMEPVSVGLWRLESGDNLQRWTTIRETNVHSGLFQYSERFNSAISNRIMRVIKPNR